MSEYTEQNFEDKLKKVVETIDVASALTKPLIDSIKDLLRSSAASLNSDEASVLVRDSQTGDLKFLLAIGEVADQLTGLHVPSGKGIAGFVFSSGQPMTISDAGQDESFYADVDKKTGFSTETLLATPLQYGDDIIGVLEYVNRIGEPPYEPFTPEEMDKAAIYAEAVSALVNAYECAKISKELSNRMISSDEPLDVAAVTEWLEHLHEAPEHKEMIDLAILVREVAARGEAERKFSKDILEAFLRYSDDEISDTFRSL